MSYEVEQTKNGKTYIYKCESYWDKEKKQPRQKRTYLGRKDEVTGRIKTKKNKIPVGSYSIGSLHFLKEICKQSNLFKVIKKVFPEDYEQILHLCFFKIIKKEPYYFYQSWCEESYILKDTFLNPSGVSKLLCKIGQDERNIQNFFYEWIKKNNVSGAIMFDITSISSYGTKNEFLERGYNRDKEDLDQINLGFLTKASDEKSVGLPVAYNIYPGSITDVVTLKNITNLINRYKLNLDFLVMDKGFYSQENIKDLSKKGLKYIVPMSFSTKLSKEILIDLNEEILLARSSFVFSESVYFYAKKEVLIGKTKCFAHVYLDKQRRASQENRLMKKISELEDKFSKKQFSTENEAKIYLEETLKSQKKYFDISKTNSTFSISRNEEVFKSEILKMGSLILITNSNDANRDDILSLYRKKDCVEKVFLSFKHDVNEKRNRTHSLINMRGSIFINFLSLILITWIDHVMKEKNLYEKMSKGELYKTLDQMKLYELATGETMLGEISKKQKDIFSAFKISKSIKPSKKI